MKVHQVWGKIGEHLANLFVGSAVEEHDLGVIPGGEASASHYGHQIIEVLNRVGWTTGQRGFIGHEHFKRAPNVL